MTYDAPPVQPAGSGPVISGWVLPQPFKGSPVFRSGRRRARLAVLTLVLAIVASIATAVHFFDGLGFAARVRGGFGTLGEGYEFDRTTSTLGTVGLVLAVATGIAFLAWLSRVVDNLYPLRLADPVPPASPRAAIGWWFVPFANYVMPYRIVADLQRRVDPVREPWLVRLWWIAWLGQGFIGVIELAIAYSAPNGIDEIGRLWSLLAAGDAVRAIAGVFAILVVLGIDGAMEERAHTPEPAVAGSPYGPPAGG